MRAAAKIPIGHLSRFHMGGILANVNLYNYVGRSTSQWVLGVAHVFLFL